jgi:cell wall-associated NlpC family hydrolase
MTPEQRAAVVAEAMTWQGTPFHHLARVKGAGVDCAQIIIAVYHACGLIPDIDTGYYPPDWHFHRRDELYRQWIERYCDPTDDPQPGDIALFHFGHCDSHGAIVIAWPTVLHAFFRRKVGTADALGDVELAGRLAGFWTLKEPQP